MAELEGRPRDGGHSILVVTADAFAPDVQRAKDAGADAVLVKPCPLERLAFELHRLVVKTGRRLLRHREQALKLKTVAR